MLHSIQEKLKYINSRIPILACVSLAVTTGILACFSLFLIETRETKDPVRYIESTTAPEPTDSRPFGSKKGETYTFSWCGGTKIKEENKVYFASETAAQASGRRISKFCEK